MHSGIFWLKYWAINDFYSNFGWSIVLFRNSWQQHSDDDFVKLCYHFGTDTWNIYRTFLKQNRQQYTAAVQHITASSIKAFDVFRCQKQTGISKEVDHIWPKCSSIWALRYTYTQTWPEPIITSNTFQKYIPWWKTNINKDMKRCVKIAMSIPCQYAVIASIHSLGIFQN